MARILSWFREPLGLMLVVGAALFGVSLARGPNDAAPREIVVPIAVIDGIRAEYAELNGTQPSPEALDELVNRWVFDQILAAEGVERGLHERDPLIQRRLIERMRDELSSQLVLAEPSDAELQEFLDANPARYALLPRASFEHVYLPEHPSDGSGAPDVTATLEQLRAGTDPARFHRPFPYGSSFARRAREQIASSFGAEFAELVIARAAAGDREWFGPVPSPFGQHLVRVTDYDAGAVAPLDRVRNRVTADLMTARRTEALRETLEQLRGSYVVVIEQAE